MKIDQSESIVILWSYPRLRDNVGPLKKGMSGSICNVHEQVVAFQIFSWRHTLCFCPILKIPWFSLQPCCNCHSPLCILELLKSSLILRLGCRWCRCSGACVGFPDLEVSPARRQFEEKYFDQSSLWSRRQISRRIVYIKRGWHSTLHLSYYSHLRSLTLSILHH